MPFLKFICPHWALKIVTRALKNVTRALKNVTRAVKKRDNLPLGSWPRPWYQYP